MPKATELPSDETRARIAAVLEQAHEVKRAVIRFTVPARDAIAAFDGEVNPHHLPDDDYETVAQESGLTDLMMAVGVTAALLSSLRERG